MSDSPGTLLALPPELLARTAWFLTTAELGNLRRTCKDIESKLFESFAYEFFHKRQFMIEEPSLQTLLDISKHPTLSKRLTEVIISLDQYPDAYTTYSETSERLLIAGYTHRNVLISSGQARDILVEAFQNLPNLRKVGLRDYDAQGRYREGEKARWRSYGHEYVERGWLAKALAHQPWALLLSALGLSGAPVSNVEVFLRGHERLMDCDFDVLSKRMTPTIAPILSGLKTLMLSLAPDIYAGNLIQAGPPNNIHLAKFLHHATSIEHLRLNFSHGPSALIGWLSLPPPSQPIKDVSSYCTSSPALSELSTLALGMVSVNTTTLAQILGRLHLKSMSLWKVVLTSDHHFDRKTTPMNPATKFLTMLAKMPNVAGNMQHAMLGFLSVNGEKDQNERACIIDFPPLPTATSKKDGKKDPSASPKRPEHQTVKYRAGHAAGFAGWASEYAARATAMKNPRYDYDSELGSDDFDSDSDSGTASIEVLSEDEDDEDDDA